MPFVSAGASGLPRPPPAVPPAAACTACSAAAAARRSARATARTAGGQRAAYAAGGTATSTPLCAPGRASLAMPRCGQGALAAATRPSVPAAGCLGTLRYGREWPTMLAGMAAAAAAAAAAATGRRRAAAAALGWTLRSALAPLSLKPLQHRGATGQQRETAARREQQRLPHRSRSSRRVHRLKCLPLWLRHRQQSSGKRARRAVSMVGGAAGQQVRRWWRLRPPRQLQERARQKTRRRHRRGAAAATAAEARRALRLAQLPRSRCRARSLLAQSQCWVQGLLATALLQGTRRESCSWARTGPCKTPPSTMPPCCARHPQPTAAACLAPLPRAELRGGTSACMPSPPRHREPCWVVAHLWPSLTPNSPLF